MIIYKSIGGNAFKSTFNIDRNAITRIAWPEATDNATEGIGYELIRAIRVRLCTDEVSTETEHA
jgi:hypothetical protein